MLYNVMLLCSSILKDKTQKEHKKDKRYNQRRGRYNPTIKDLKPQN